MYTSIGVETEDSDTYPWWQSAEVGPPDMQFNVNAHDLFKWYSLIWKSTSLESQ